MRKTLYAEGGRPFYDDDIQTIQDEAYAVSLAFYQALGHDCIVTGCGVSATGSTYTVAPGIVWMGGELLRCLGASGVSLPIGLVTGPVTVLDERTYQTGDTKTCIQEQYAVVVPYGGAGLQLYAAGGLTIQHVLRSAQWEVGDVKHGQLNLALFDGTGLGLPGTTAWGWGLCNGQGGRLDLGGRALVGYDSNTNDYAAVGNAGGAAQVTLTIPNLPPHTHDANFRISDSGQDYPFGAARNSGLTSNGSQITTKQTGGGQPFDNRPPYLVLAARQWVGF